MTEPSVVSFLMEFNDFEAVARDVIAPLEGVVEFLSSLLGVNVVSLCAPGVLLELASRDMELKSDSEKLEFHEPGDIELASIVDDNRSLDISSVLGKLSFEVIEPLVGGLDILEPVSESAGAL